MWSDTRWTWRCEHDDHVGIHSHSRDRDSKGQWLLKIADRRDDLGESALVSVFGAAVGLLMGICFLFGLKFIPALHGYVDVAVQPLVVLIVIALALLTGVAGALYPAIYAMRIRAVEALRFE